MVVVVPVVVVEVVAVVVVDVDVVVVDVVVVVVVPAANADAAPSAASRTARTKNQTPRRIAPVCRSLRFLADFLQRRAIYAMGTCSKRLGSIRSRISVRLEPVAVIPWLRRPTTVCAGSGDAATRAATLSASSEVPQG